MQNMSPNINTNDFQALIKKPIASRAENIVYAGYWKNVWVKLSSNPAAVLSLLILIFLISFSLAGPVFWRVDPALQNLTQLSQPPAFRQRALIVADQESWQTPVWNAQDLRGKERLANLRLAEGENAFMRAHTESVKLIWTPDAQASYYRIYRHILYPSGPQDLGLPLAERDNYLFTHYEDRLQLEARKYFYTVAAIDRNENLIAYETLEVELVRAAKLSLVKEKLQQGEWHLEAPNLPDDERINHYVTLRFHPMGTDYLGRDMMARLMKGGQTSLLIGFIASLLFVAAGALYGAISAYLGGRVDNVLMRFADFIIALPFLLFMILLKVAFGIGPGESGIGVMIFSLIILSWPASARLVRGQVLLLREQSFVLVAKLNGAGLSYILGKHLLPNVFSVILVSLSFAIPSVILTEAFLSFIGLGVVPPTPSWGSMCQDGIKTFLFHPHELLFPAGFIAMTVLAFNVLGDGLRDAMDVQTESNS